MSLDVVAIYINSDACCSKCKRQFEYAEHVEMTPSDGLICVKCLNSPNNLPITKEKVIKFINEKDCGWGTSQTELEKMFGTDIIKKMFEHGDIFEIRPRMIKVLR